MSMSRRDVCRGLSVLALVPAGLVEAQEKVAAKDCVEPVLSQCAAFPFEALPVRYSGEGAPTRQILEGRIPGSEIIELHETSLAPGKMPHPPHKHPHAELLMVRTGLIEFQSDAAPVRVTAGGAAYCAPNQMHGFRNVGEVEATYFVLKVGSQPVCQK
jgi:quercetin dioxygenase-like cupin family protein